MVIPDDLYKLLLERLPDVIKQLPELYHPKAEKDKSPLRTLLLLMEYYFGAIGRRITDIDTYFDVWKTPGKADEGKTDFLSWLGSWVALIPEQDWTEQKKRYAISIAADLYRYRGTIPGLRYMLALFFDIQVDIKEWEWTKGMQIGVRNTIGIDTRIDDRFNINHCFTVTWKPNPEELKSKSKLEHKIARIRAMIDREKPAHTFCYLNVAGYEEEEVI